MWVPDDHNITDIFAFLGVCVTQSVFYLLNRRSDNKNIAKVVNTNVAVAAEVKQALDVHEAAVQENFQDVQNAIKDNKDAIKENTCITKDTKNKVVSLCEDK